MPGPPGPAVGRPEDKLDPGIHSAVASPVGDCFVGSVSIRLTLRASAARWSPIVPWIAGSSPAMTMAGYNGGRRFLSPLRASALAPTLSLVPQQRDGRLAVAALWREYGNAAGVETHDHALGFIEFHDCR